MTRAAFFDVDGTLTTSHMWRGLMEYFVRHRLKSATHLAFRAVHYPMYFMRRLGLLSESGFRTPWASHLTWYLRGFTEEQACHVWDWIVTDFLDHGDGSNSYWRDDSRNLLQKHLDAGDVVMLVSSSPQPLVRRIARALGAEHAIGTRFELRDGRYTGRSLQPVCIDAYKASMAKDYLRDHGLQIVLSSSYAYADSTPDLHLLEMVRHPVAVYPDDELRILAQQRGWRIFP